MLFLKFLNFQSGSFVSLVGKLSSASGACLGVRFPFLLVFMSTSISLFNIFLLYLMCLIYGGRMDLVAFVRQAVMFCYCFWDLGFSFTALSVGFPMLKLLLGKRRRKMSLSVEKLTSELGLFASCAPTFIHGWLVRRCSGDLGLLKSGSLKVSLMESGIWVALKYYTINFAPSATRFTATMERTQVVANTLGTFTLLLVFVLRSFIIAKSIQMQVRNSSKIMDAATCKPRKEMVSALGDSKAVVVNEDDNKMFKNPLWWRETTRFQMQVRTLKRSWMLQDANPKKKGMVFPFQPLPLTFNHVNYYVDITAEMKAQ
ncbi:hypothetical protein PTKIN_Ptkin04bG0086200 [Pterospermum kingtungense]